MNREMFEENKVLFAVGIVVLIAALVAIAYYAGWF